MELNETKAQFIQLRAEGYSYDKIADKLSISKSTCTAWERQFKEEIETMKHEQLKELYEMYFMTKEARIKKLGGTLSQIEDALDDADLTEIPPEKLLDYKLKYIDALKEEYTGSTVAYDLNQDADSRDIMKATGDLINRIRRGEISKEQARTESIVLANILRAYNTVEVEEKLEALENIVGGRKQWA